MTTPEGFSITAMDYRTEPDGFGGTIEGYAAHVTHETGGSWHLSKLVGEDRWTIDAQFRANGAPVKANGFGARYLTTYAVANDALTDALDATANASAGAAIDDTGRVVKS